MQNNINQNITEEDNYDTDNGSGAVSKQYVIDDGNNEADVIYDDYDYDVA